MAGKLGEARSPPHPLLSHFRGPHMFTRQLLHLLTYLLSAYYVPGTVLGAGDKMICIKFHGSVFDSQIIQIVTQMNVRSLP